MLGSYLFYYIHMSVLLENTPLVKFIRNNIRISQIVLKFVGVQSKYLRVNLESLRQSLVIFRNCSVMFVRSSDKFWRIFGNLRKVIIIIIVIFNEDANITKWFTEGSSKEY